MEKIYSGKRKNYIVGALLILLLVFVLWFITAENAKQVITEYSSEYVALAELPSQLSFTYYEEEEWEQKLKEVLHKDNLNGRLNYGNLEQILEQLSVQEYIKYEKGFFGKVVPRSEWNEVYQQVLD